MFPSLAYFNLLYQPVFQASLAISRQYAVRPSWDRLVGFLFAEESFGLEILGVDGVVDGRRQRLSESGQRMPTVEFHDATMGYLGVSNGDANPDSEGFENTTDETKLLKTTSTSPSLRIGDLQIPQGRLTTVIGLPGPGRAPYFFPSWENYST